MNQTMAKRFANRKPNTNHRATPCPKCGNRDSLVVDSRSPLGPYVRRRRQCPCGNVYTTREVVLDKSELLPCPFCGKPGEMEQIKAISLSAERIRMNLFIESNDKSSAAKAGKDGHE